MVPPARSVFTDPIPVRRARTGGLDELTRLSQLYRLSYHLASGPSERRTFRRDRLEASEAVVFVDPSARDNLTAQRLHGAQGEVRDEQVSVCRRPRG